MNRILLFSDLSSEKVNYFSINLDYKRTSLRVRFNNYKNIQMERYDERGDKLNY